MPYCLYLRKSRADTEAEAKGAGETLSRHETALLALAKRLDLTITAVYKEIVSGETIANRPVMQQLLDEVERGQWQGVLVMEITRLARGETIDQGIVAQAFKYSNTKIITPDKIYNPANEFDEEYFEFGLFMSRREYKMINQRQQRGRLASIREGKYLGNKPPYGYRRLKLENQKGWTLEPDENAATVQLIYNLFTEEKLGCSKIANRLNALACPTQSGKSWIDSVVRGILTNPVYAGWIRWGGRPQTKTASNGKIRKSRPRAAAENIILAKGLHHPIITQEQFDLAQKLFNNNRSPRGPQNNGLHNPLVGLLTCVHCGKKMFKRPNKNGVDRIICTTPGCPTVSDNLEHVEQVLLQSVSKWLIEHKLQDNLLDDTATDTSTAQTQLKKIQQEQETLNHQKKRIHELLEKDVYSIETFLERSAELAAKQKSLQQQVEELQSEITAKQKLLQSQNEIIPKMQTILETYSSTPNAEAKNRLLKSVIEKVVYSKTTNQRWSTENDLTLTIYPKLPN